MDQAAHIVLTLTYFGLTHLRIVAPSIPAIILIFTMAIAFFFHLTLEHKTKSPEEKYLVNNTSSKASLEGLYPQISTLFLNKKTCSSLIINQHLQPLFTSTNFFDFFDIDPENNDPKSLTQDILTQIIDVSCTEHLLNLIGEQDLPLYLIDKRDDLSPAELQKLTKFGSFKSLVNQTQNGTLESTIQLFFAFASTFQKSQIGWNPTQKQSNSPQFFPAVAFYRANRLTLNISYLKSKTGEDLILINFSQAAQEFESTPSNLSMIDIASVIHEIRTPLNGITFLIQEAMNDSEVKEDVKQSLLKPSLDSSRRLWYIVNDILDFAQVLEGKLKLVFDSFELAPALRQPIQIIEALGRAKGLQVILEIDPNLPSTITTDQNRLVQVVYNLMGNALKFTKEGYVKLKVSAADKRAKFIDFTVEDTGYGIKPEDLCRLFKTFEKLDNWHDNKTGSGLGLCISNALSKALGKGLSVKSEYQKGSKFTFSVENIRNAAKSTASIIEVSTTTNINSSSRAAMSFGVASSLALNSSGHRKAKTPKVGGYGNKESFQTIMEETVKENVRANIKAYSEGNSGESSTKHNQKSTSNKQIQGGSSVTSLDQLCFKDQNNNAGVSPKGLLTPIAANNSRNESNEVSIEIPNSARQQTVYYDFNFPSYNQLPLKPLQLERKSRSVNRTAQTVQVLAPAMIEEVEGREEEELNSPQLPAGKKFNRSGTYIPLLLNSKPMKDWPGNESPLIKCKCPRILGVDDEPVNILILKFLMKQLGVNGRFFNNGESLIEYLVDDAPDDYCSCGGPLLTLMDCFMPNKNGFEVTRDLRELMDEGRIPRMYIVACTADESEDMKGKVFEAGMNDYVKKPITKAQLEHLIRKYIER